MDITLETSRTFLRSLALEDAEILYRYRSSPDVYVFHAWNPETLEEAESFIRVHSVESKAGIGEWKQLGIYAKEDGSLIGDCGFYRSVPGEAEIGYTVIPEFQSRGIATEVVRALAAFLFAELPVERILAKTDPGNAGSIKVLERLGFERISHLVKNVQIRGEWKDDLVFCLRWG